MFIAGARIAKAVSTASAGREHKTIKRRIMLA